MNLCTASQTLPELHLIMWITKVLIFPLFSCFPFFLNIFHRPISGWFHHHFVIMPVHLKTKKITVLRKTVGGGVKRIPVKNRCASQLDRTPLTPLYTAEEAPSCSNDAGAETAYNRDKRRELDMWASLRSEMLQSAFQSSAPNKDCCTICKNPAEYRCLECSFTSVFCATCIRATHQNSLHLHEKWNVSTYLLMKRNPG